MTIDTYMHDTGPNPFYTTLRLYFIQSIVCKQFSDGCPNPILQYFKAILHPKYSVQAIFR